MFYRRRRSGINYQKVPTAGLYAEIRYLEKQKAENKDLFIKYDQFFPIYKRKFFLNYNIIFNRSRSFSFPSQFCYY